MRTSVDAPAKLNLALAVGARREDGFHELVSLLHRLDLADRLDIDLKVTGSSPDVLVEAPGIPGGDTLITAAVTALLEQVGRGARCWITVDKSIPIGGGLGGGSSDAAAALLAVHRLLGAPLPHDELLTIAAAVGSDVPSFLTASPACVVTGRGEHVQAIRRPFERRAWLLCCPPVEQSTAEVYAAYSPVRETLPSPVELESGVRSGVCFNDLDEAARACCPQLDRLCQALEDAGGAPLVCGSGATVAVRVTSGADRAALEAVARHAAPGCWLRLTRQV